MPSQLPTMRAGQPIGNVNGQPVFADPTWFRYWTQQQFDAINSSISSSSDSLGNISEITSLVGHLWVDELVSEDINYWLTREEIADTHSGVKPTINLTAKIQAAINALWNKSQTPARKGTNSAVSSQVAVLRLHGCYMVDQLYTYPGVVLQGDALSETILIQSPNATTDFITVLARNGHSSKQRASWGLFKDLTLQGDSTILAPDGITGLHGLTCESAGNDPFYVAGDNYNSYIANNVRVYGFSGDGFHCPTSRKRARHVECRSSTNLGNGFFLGNSADAFFTECASGSNGQHSVYVVQADTPRFVGGDFWASNNAAAGLGGYRAFYMDRVHEGIIFGCDINGAFEFAGTNNPSDTEYYQTDYKFTLDSCNFKFRAGSFGDGGDGSDGVPDPLDGYVIVSNARGVNTRNCSYQPAFDRSTGLATYRPSNIYFLSGDTVFQADDKLPDINSGLWPCGAVVAFPGVYDDICNSWTKLTGQWLQPNVTTSQHATLMTYWSKVPTKAGGQIGRNDGVVPTAGTVGEVISAKVTSGSPVALTTATAVDVTFIDLTPGEWDIYGSVVFQGAAATGSIMKTAISTASGTIPSVNANAYASSLIPFAALTGDIQSLQVGPVRAPLDSSSATYRYYLTVRSTFSAGTMAAFGQIQARRIA